MKIEIETATNGYIITIPPEYEDSIEKKIVIQEFDVKYFYDTNYHLNDKGMSIRTQKIIQMLQSQTEYNASNVQSISIR